MSPTESAKVCAFIASRCPQQRFEPATVEAWYSDLQETAYSDAIEAARRCTAARPFVALSELLAMVRTIGNERHEQSTVAALEAAKGPAVSMPRDLFVLPQREEEDIPRDPTALDREAAMTSPCLYCGAKPKQPCTVMGRDRQTPHPLRGKPDEQVKGLRPAQSLNGWPS